MKKEKSNNLLIYGIIVLALIILVPTIYFGLNKQTTIPSSLSQVQYIEFITDTNKVISSEEIVKATVRIRPVDLSGYRNLKSSQLIWVFKGDDLIYTHSGSSSYPFERTFDITGFEIGDTELKAVFVLTDYNYCGSGMDGYKICPDSKYVWDGVCEPIHGLLSSAECGILKEIDSTNYLMRTRIDGILYPDIGIISFVDYKKPDVAQQFKESGTVDVIEKSITIQRIRDFTEIPQACIDMGYDTVELCKQNADLVVDSLEGSVTDKIELIQLLQLETDAQLELIGQLELTIGEQANLINALSLNLAQKAELVSRLHVETEEQAQLIKAMELSFAEQGEIISLLNLEIEDDVIIINSLSRETGEQAEIISNIELSNDQQLELIKALRSKTEAQQELIDILQSEKMKTHIIMGVLIVFLVIMAVFAYIRLTRANKKIKGKKRR